MPSPREVTVVIDAPRGALPAFTLASPWWQEAEPVVTAVRERFGLEIVVLRLLEGEVPFETPVTYLAELMRGDAGAAARAMGEAARRRSPEAALRASGWPRRGSRVGSAPRDDHRPARADPDVEPVVDLEDPH